MGGGGWGQGQDLETKANRDSQSTLEKVSFFDWYSLSSTREYLTALAGLVCLTLENFFFFLAVGIFHFFLYYIKHCFICCPSDSTVPTDAAIEPRTVATGA
jgi:hypothetical protein